MTDEDPKNTPVQEAKEDDLADVEPEQNIDASAETTEEDDDEDEDRPSFLRDSLFFLWETFRVIIISLAIIIPVRYFIVQPFFVKGASMENTFHDGEYILIDEVTYRFKNPERGDITVFRYPRDPDQFFIKRVIGLPGETVDVRNNQVRIYSKDDPQGTLLEESYLSEHQVTLGDLRTVLGPEEYFVMGDNRLRSSDSRSWGALGREFITGRVFFRAWPLSKLGAFKDPIYNIE